MKENIFKIFRKLYYFKYFVKFSSSGTNIVLSRGGLIIKPENIQLGFNIFINRNFMINANGGIFIGNNVMIGPNLLIETDDHKYGKLGISMFEYSFDKISSKVIIENDVWIGGNVTILKGVKIGEGSIVGAGSVVSKDILPYTISVGVPCKRLKTRFNKDELKIHLKLVNSNYSFEELEKIYNA